MKKKIVIIIGVISLSILIYAGIASTCALKKVNQLEGEVDKVAQKQEEFFNELEKVTQDVPVVIEDQKPEDTDEIDYEDITKDWKIYRNEELGFEIKHPAEFNEFSGGKNHKEEIFVNLGDVRIVYIYITVKNNSEKKSAKELIESNLKDHFTPQYQTYKLTKTFISGKEGFLITFPNAREHILLDYVEHNNKAYFIGTRHQLMING